MGNSSELVNYNRDELSIRSSSANDVRLSLWEYYDMIDPLLDDKLSAQARAKFQRLYLSNSIAPISILALTLPLAWIPTKWVVGFANRGMASSRANFIGMAIFYPLFVYYGTTVPIPRRLYTELVTDNGIDGSYIRSTLRNRKPGLWLKMSAQLHKNKFSFPEMMEYKRAVDFPSIKY